MPSVLREIIASLMHSSLYFTLPLPERLALAKRLAFGQMPGPDFKRVWKKDFSGLHRGV
jgi:hypothetical protein